MSVRWAQVFATSLCFLSLLLCFAFSQRRTIKVWFLIEAKTRIYRLGFFLGSKEKWVHRRGNSRPCSARIGSSKLVIPSLLQLRFLSFSLLLKTMSFSCLFTARLNGSSSPWCWMQFLFLKFRIVDQILLLSLIHWQILLPTIVMLLLIAVRTRVDTTIHPAHS